MKYFLGCLFLAFVLGSGALPAAAVNNYYASPSGSGTACTIGSPCSLSTAMSQATVGSSGSCQFGTWLAYPTSDIKQYYGATSAAGACIHLLDGIYGGAFSNTKSGALTTRFVIASENRNGAKFTSGTASTSGSYSDIDGIDITTPNSSAMNFLPSGTHMAFMYNYIHDVNVTGCSPTGTISELNQPTSDNLIDGNVIRHASTYSVGAVNCVEHHGVYSEGQRTLIVNNIISGITGWGIKRNMISTACGPGIINNNTIFNNGGGIDITEGESTLECVWDFNSMNNNIIVNNGTDDPGGGRYGINFFHYNDRGTTSTHNVVSNNLVYGNVPGNYATHDAPCSPGTTLCPSTNIKTDASTAITFTNFQFDGNTAPASSYSALNYQAKTGSSAIGGGTTSCATSPGVSPCIPSSDWKVSTVRANPPTIGAFDVGGGGGGGTATLQASPTSVPFGPITVGVASSVASVSITNTGTANATLGTPDATITGTNASSFIPGGTGTCTNGTVIAPGSAGCTESLKCQPTTTGSLVGQLNVLSDASNPTLTVPLSCTGTAPATPHFLPPAAPIDFGSHNVFTNSSSQNYRITSDGTAPLSVTGLAFANSVPFSGIDDFPSTDLVTNCNPSGTQHWCGTHDSGTPGTASGTSALTSAPALDGQSRQFIPSGTAFGGFRYSVWLGAGAPNAVPNVFVSDFNIEFTTSLAHVTNLEFDHNQSIADGQLVIFGTQCNMTKGLWQVTGKNPVSGGAQWLDTAAVCTRAQWTLNTFHHVTAVYHRDSLGNVTYDSITFDGTTQNIGVTVASVFTLSGWPAGTQVENVQFDGDSTAWTVTAYLDSFTLTGYSDFFPPSTGTCGAVPFTVAAGAFCDVPVIFSPSATGSRVGTITLTHNAAGSPSVTALTGNGTQPNASLTPSVSFGTVALNVTSGAQSAILTNTGTGNLTVSAASSTANFTFTGPTLPATVLPSGTLTFSLFCTPTASGPINGQFQVTDDAPSPVQIANLSCTGQAPSGNGILVNGGVLFTGGVRVLQ